MHFKSVIVTLIIIFSLSACSVNKVVYRIDVPQGNYLEGNTVAKVQAGMNKEQVQYLLGTPVLTDPFNNNTGYYVYLQQHAYDKPEQHTFVVQFDQNGIVTQTDLNAPLPTNDNVDENNTIITAPEPTKKRWWPFGKK